MTQLRKKRVLEDNRNKNVKYHRMESSMEEYVYTFHTVVESEKWNYGNLKFIQYPKLFRGC